MSGLEKGERERVWSCVDCPELHNYTHTLALKCGPKGTAIRAIRLIARSLRCTELALRTMEMN